jgi:predicted permease
MSRQDDYDEELREHIEIETRENIGRGLPPDEARRAAIRTFGNSTAIRQDLREGGTFYWLDTLIQDLQYGLRLIRRSPLLSCATVLTLTFGIGINTGVFTFLNGALLRARVEKEPDTFAHLSAETSGEAGRAVLDWGVSIDDFRAYQGAVRSMNNIAAWSIGRATMGTEDPTQWLVLPVTCNFFSLYGLDRPKLGRLFRSDECATPGASPVAVLGEDLWRSRFASDPNILGTQIRLNHEPFTIVGIAPRRFSGQLRGPGIWVPYTMQAVFFGGHDFFRETSVRWLTLEGRLTPGHNRASAQAELAVLAAGRDALHRGRRSTIFITNGSFVQEPAMRAQVLWVAPLIMGALMLLLLLACTNVTMLFLSRAVSRQREIAIRLSLGAGRQRLLRMLLTESLILAIVSGCLSAWIAGMVPALIDKWNPGMPYYPLQPDMLVFGYLAAITLLAGIVAGMAPAAESLKADLSATLKNQEGFFGSSRGLARAFLVGSQVAMCLVLLAGAGLFVRAGLTSFRASPGFETRQVLVFSARPPVLTAAASEAFYLTLVQRLRAIRAIQSVCFASAPPMSNDEGTGPNEEVRLPGQEKGTGLKANVNSVTPEFFDTLGIPIVRGRAFRGNEIPAPGASPIIVSEALARARWPNEDAIGRVLLDADGVALEIIGIARDVKSQRFGVTDGPLFYRLRTPQFYGGPILVRFFGDATPAQAAVLNLLREMSPQIPPRVETLQTVAENFAAIFWKMAEIVLLLGLAAMVLAVAGIYGVVAFSVSRRTREMGIRIALGATRGDIVHSVIARSLRPILAGLGVGVLFAVAGGRVLEQAFRTLPVGLNTADPVVYLTVALLLGATAVAAMLGPAWRAVRTDPLQALRQD